ncbi:unnamed protein product, partial [Symbiodinium microadriaticum]
VFQSIMEEDTEADNLLNRMARLTLRRRLRCPYSLLWHDFFEKAMNLTEVGGRQESVHDPWQRMREICRVDGQDMTRWFGPDACQAYGHDAILLAALETSLKLEAHDVDMLLEVVFIYARKSVQGILVGPDVHMAIRKLWPILPHLAKLGSLGLMTTILAALRSEDPTDGFLESIADAAVNAVSSDRFRPTDRMDHQLKEIELLLTALSQMCTAGSCSSSRIVREK